MLLCQLQKRISTVNSFSIEHELRPHMKSLAGENDERHGGSEVLVVVATAEVGEVNCVSPKYESSNSIEENSSCSKTEEVKEQVSIFIIVIVFQINTFIILYISHAYLY